MAKTKTNEIIVGLDIGTTKIAAIAGEVTDEGIDGLGYTLAFGGGGAESIQVYLETRLKPLIVGEDPLVDEPSEERPGVPQIGPMVDAVEDLPCVPSGQDVTPRLHH